jgi:hypothetical protein
MLATFATLVAMAVPAGGQQGSYYQPGPGAFYSSPFAPVPYGCRGGQVGGFYFPPDQGRRQVFFRSSFDLQIGQARPTYYLAPGTGYLAGGSPFGGQSYFPPLPAYYSGGPPSFYGSAGYAPRGGL